jgi:hypothetical protein
VKLTVWRIVLAGYRQQERGVRGSMGSRGGSKRAITISQIKLFPLGEKKKINTERPDEQ